MKICFIVSTLKASGPINIVYNIAKFINREKFDLNIITLSPETKGSLKEQFEEIGVSVHSLDLGRIDGVLKGPNKLKQLIKEINPNIIHSHGHRADFFSEKYLKVYTRVSTVHNYPYDDYVLKYGKLVGYPLAKINITSFRRIEGAVACSKSIKNQIQHHGIDSLAIQNGVDNTIFKPIENPQIKQKVKSKLGLDEKGKIFISIGSLNKRKNPLLLIRAFKKANLKNVILLILGSGPLLEQCKIEVGTSENIKLLGHVTNPLEYLQISDYFVSTSLSEGLPNTVLESLATETPVILSNIGPHREIIEINDAAGLVFEPDEDSLIEAFKKTEVKDLNSLIENTREIIKKLNAREMASNYESYYIKCYRENNN